MTTGMLWTITHDHLGETGGMLPQKMFGNLDPLRTFLIHCGSCFGDSVVVWTFGNKKGLSPQD